MNWQFAYPWVLIFASLIPLIWIVRVLRWHRSTGLMTSAPSRVAAAGTSLRTLGLWVPNAIISIALIALLVALARPQRIVGNTKATRDTIALELVVDRSGSMDEPVIFDGQRTNRLEAVKKVVERFVEGDGSKLRGRTGDLLGLIVFGSFADTLMPLTQSHDALIEALRRIELPRVERERSTAIGDALMLAIGRLKASEDVMRANSEDESFELKSKAVVLLTDGENRAGQYSPQQAAGLAKEWGVKVYIIGIRGGTTSGGRFFGASQQVNDRQMTQVAEHTGGQYWGVDRISDLEEVYAKIDELERSSVEVSESTSYEELFQPYAIAGTLVLIGGVLLRETIMRSVA
jgi:Ca-activated chloride channel family protein